MILVISVDGLYHLMKLAENEKRKLERETSKALLMTCFQHEDLDTQVTEAIKLMKKVAA